MAKRYNEETLQVTYKGKNIYDVLEMTVEEAIEFFSSIHRIKSKLQTLRRRPRLRQAGSAGDDVIRREAQR